MSDILDLCFDSPSWKVKELLDESFKCFEKHFPKSIHFYMPGLIHFHTSFYRATNPYRFPGISLTGLGCHLNCEHCRGKILKSMIPAVNPKDLFEVCVKIKKMGGKGCLISGGSSRDGSVPLFRFISTIKDIKERLGLRVVVHTGLVKAEVAEALAEAKIDAALIDIIGSNEVVRSIYHLDATVEDYERSLTLLEDSGVPVVPHILVGLYYGRLLGEKEALRIVSRHQPEAVIIVALKPLEQTPMEHVLPPAPIDVARVIVAARLLMPETPLILGCARTGGEYKAEVDTLAVRAGVNGIAFPSEEAYELAESLGLEVNFSEECCALIYQDLKARGGLQ